jgi:hypothetical protein
MGAPSHRVRQLTEQGYAAIDRAAEVTDVFIAVEPPWDRLFYALNLETEEEGIVVTRAIPRRTQRAV